MRNVFISATTTALAVIIASTSAFAASPNFCDHYASKAVHAEEKNIDEDCGFDGARWSFDYSGHYSWCLLVTKGQANSETYARKASLIDCEGDY